MSNRVLSLDQWQEIQMAPFGVTIGNFDGLHLGHQDLIKDFLSRCKQKGLEPVAFTFVPHPELYFSPEKDHLLTSYKRKRELLFNIGVTTVVEVDFGEVRNLEGEEFAKKYLLSRKQLGLLWIGHDFTFGKNKVGPSADEFSGIELAKSAPFKKSGGIVSSSRIRALVRLGDMEGAKELLGRPFCVEGEVRHGKKLGRKIGFPTANIFPGKNIITPRLGVYIAETLIDDSWRPALLNVGRNPSVEAGQDIKWEAHVLDFSGDLYGKTLMIRLNKFQRAEKKFKDTQELAAQIKTDLEDIKKSGSK